MGLNRVLKSAANRDEIVDAVVKKAQKIAKRKGITLEKAEAEIWAQGDATAAYERAAPSPPPTSAATLMKNPSDVLDERARKRMKRNPGMTYAKACDEELMEDQR